MNKCPHCGEILDEDAHFCLYCMASLEEKTKVIPSEKNKTFVVLGIIIAFLVAVIIVLSGIILSYT